MEKLDWKITGKAFDNTISEEMDTKAEGKVRQLEEFQTYIIHTFPHKKGKSIQANTHTKYSYFLQENFCALTRKVPLLLTSQLNKPNLAHTAAVRSVNMSA